MARKKAADGPGLFGADEEPDPTAYPKPGPVRTRLNDHTELPVGVQALREMHADGIVECGPTLELMPDGSTVVHEAPARPGRAALRPVIAELAREVIDPVVARANRLEAAIRRALPWLDDEQGIPQPLTAFNILSQAIEPKQEVSCAIPS